MVFLGTNKIISK